MIISDWDDDAGHCLTDGKRRRGGDPLGVSDESFAVNITVEIQLNITVDIHLELGFTSLCPGLGCMDM